MKPRLIAHRGWSSLFPENSIAAFTAATAAGADEVELDVRVTADNIPVVIHDRTIDRTTDGSGQIAELTYRQVTEFSMTKNNVSYPCMPIPTLNDVLETIASNTTINLHIYETGNGAVTEVLRRHLDGLKLNGSYLALRKDLIPELSIQLPELEICLLRGNLAPMEQVHVAAQLNCRRIQLVSSMYDAESIVTARDLGIHTNLFYADDTASFIQATENGIDSVLTNRVGEIQQEVAAMRNN